MKKDISSIFKSISHPIRVQILLMLSDHLNTGLLFSEISRQLEMESSGKLSFHLEKLANLISQNSQGRYLLTDQGHKAVEAVKLLGVHGSEEIGAHLSYPVEVASSDVSYQEKPIVPSNAKSHSRPSKNQRNLLRKLLGITILLLILSIGLTGYILYNGTATKDEISNTEERYSIELFNYVFAFEITKIRGSDNQYNLMMSIDIIPLTDDYQDYYLSAFYYSVSNNGEKRYAVNDTDGFVLADFHGVNFEVDTTLGFVFFDLTFQVNFKHRSEAIFGTFTSLVKHMKVTIISYSVLLIGWIVLLSTVFLLRELSKKSSLQ